MRGSFNYVIWLPSLFTNQTSWPGSQLRTVALDALGKTSAKPSFGETACNRHLNGELVNWSFSRAYGRFPMSPFVCHFWQPSHTTIGLGKTVSRSILVLTLVDRNPIIERCKKSRAVPYAKVFFPMLKFF